MSLRLSNVVMLKKISDPVGFILEYPAYMDTCGNIFRIRSSVYRMYEVTSIKMHDTSEVRNTPLPLCYCLYSQRETSLFFTLN